jgi:hypothetical protein
MREFASSGFAEPAVCASHDLKRSWNQRTMQPAGSFLPAGFFFSGEA